MFAEAHCAPSFHNWQLAPHGQHCMCSKALRIYWLQQLLIRIVTPSLLLPMAGWLRSLCIHFVKCALCARCRTMQRRIHLIDHVWPAFFALCSAVPAAQQQQQQCQGRGRHHRSGQQLCLKGHCSKNSTCTLTLYTAIAGTWPVCYRAALHCKQQQHRLLTVAASACCCALPLTQSTGVGSQQDTVQVPVELSITLGQHNGNKRPDVKTPSLHRYAMHCSTHVSIQQLS